MRMHRTRFEVALALQPQSTQRFGRPGYRRFQVNPATDWDGPGGGLQGRFKPRAIKGRVDEDQVHTARGQTTLSAHRVTALNTHDIGLEAADVVLQQLDQHSVLLDHQHMCRTARCGF